MYMITTSSTQQSISTRVIAYCCCWGILSQLCFSAVAVAGPVVDPTAPIEFRPTVHQAPNGADVVDIAAPSAGGVSLNRYDKFDVENKGAVLNNSRLDGQSTLAGFLAANPNLSSRSAKLIVNEVMGASSSQILGQIEVFGDKASVIIANPYGVHCDGCGFINTDNVSLTTGRPILTGGDIQLDVRSEAGVTIAEGGLRGDMTALSLVAGHINLNGATVIGGKLNLVAGDLLYDFGNASVVQTRNSNDEAAIYAIDATQFGAMRAGSINIIVEGQNAGVRLMGYANADQGNLNIDAQGNVSLRGTSAAGKLSISGADVVQEKDFTAGRNIEINANNLTVAEGGAIQTAESLTITSTGVATLYGDTQVRGSAEITAPGGIVIGEEFIAGNQVKLNTAGTVTFAEGLVSASKLIINGTATETLGGATLRIGESLLIDGGNVDFAEDSYLVATDATIDLLNNSNFSNSAQIIGESLNTSGVLGSNNAEGLIQVGNLDIAYSDSFNNAGNIEASNLGQVNTPVLNNLATGTLLAPNVDVLGFFNNHGTVSNQGDLSISTSNGLTSTGALLSGGSLQLQSQGRLSLSGRVEGVSGVNTSSTSGGVFLNDLALLTQGDWALNTGGQQLTVNNLEAGALNSHWQAQSTSLSGTVTLQAEQQEINLSDGFSNDANFNSLGDLTLNASNVINQGSFISTGSAILNADSLNNQGDFIVSELTLNTSDFINSGSFFSNNLTIDTDSEFTNQEGRIEVSEQFTLSSAGINNEKGTVLTARLLATLTGDVNNTSGTLQATDTLTLSGGGLDNTLGFISLGEGSITLSGNVLNSSGQIRAKALNLNANSYSSNGSSVLYASGTLSSSVTGAFTNNYLVQADGTLSISAGAVRNNHTLVASGMSVTSNGAFQNFGNISGNSLALAATGQFDNLGQVYGSSSLNISAATLNNNGVLYGGSNQITVSNTFTNSGSTQGNTVLLNAGGVNNLEGATILASQTAELNGDKIFINNGKLFAFNSLSVTADELINTSQIGASELPLSIGNQAFTGEGTVLVNNLILNVGDVNNSGEILAASNATIKLSGLLENSGDIYAQHLHLGQHDGDAPGLGNIVNHGDILADTLSATVGKIENYQLIQADVIESINATSLSNSVDANLLAGAADITLSGELSNKGIISISNKFTLSAGSLNNFTSQDSQTAAELLAGSADITLSGALTNGSIFAISDRFTLTAKSLSNTNVIQAGQLDWTLADKLTNSGKIAALTGDSSITASTVLNQLEGLISGQQALSLSFSKDLTNKNEISSQTVLSLTGNDIVNSGGAILIAAQKLQGSGVTGTINNSGVIAAGVFDNDKIDESVELLLSANTLDNRASGLIYSTGSALVEVTDALNNHQLNENGESSFGRLVARGDLGVSAKTLNNKGLLSSGSTLTISDTGSIINDGAVVANALNINTATLNNELAAIFSSATDFVLTATADVNNQGKLIASDLLRLNAGELTNSGTINASNVDLDIEGLLDNSKDIIALAELSIQAGSLNNQTDGKIHSGGSTTVTVADTFTNSGQLFTNNVLTTTSAALFNNGNIYSGDATLQLGKLSNKGEISALADWNQTGVGQGQLIIRSQQLVQTASSARVNAAPPPSETSTNTPDLKPGSLMNEGSIVAGSSEISATTFDNVTGMVTAFNDLSFDLSGQFSNRSDNNTGRIQAGNDITITAHHINNQHTLLSIGALTMTGQSFENSSNISSETSLNFDIDDTFSNTGSIVAADALNVTARKIDLKGGSDNSKARLQGATVELYAPTVNINQHGLLVSTGALNFNQLTTNLNNSGLIQAVSANLNTTAGNGSWTNNGTAVFETLQLSKLGSYSSNGGLLQVNNSIDWTATGAMSLSNAKMVSLSANISLTAPTVTNSSSVIQALNGRITINTDTYQNLGSAKLLAKEINTDMRVLVNTGSLDGNITSSGRLEELINNGGSIVANSIDWNLVVLENQGGDIASRTGVNINIAKRQGVNTTSARFNNNGGKIYADNGDMTLTTEGGFSNDGDLLAARGTLSITAEDYLVNHGDIGATAVSFNAKTIEQRGGLIALNKATLNAESDILFAKYSLLGEKTLNWVKDIEAQADTITNKGVIQGKGYGNLTPNVGGAFINEGTINLGSLRIGAEELAPGTFDIAPGVKTITNSGEINIAGRSTLIADVTSNTGQIYADTASVFGWEEFDNSGGVISTVRDLGAHGGKFANVEGYLSSHALTVAATKGDLDNSGGVIYGKKSVNLDVFEGNLILGSIESETGERTESLIYSGGELALDVVKNGLQLEGDVYAAGNTTITIGGNLNQMGRVAAKGDLTLSVAGEFVSGYVKKAGDTEAVEYEPGSAYTASLGNITIKDTGVVRIQDSLLQSAGNINITGTNAGVLSVDGKQGRIYAMNDLNISGFTSMGVLEIGEAQDNINVEASNININLSGSFFTEGNIKASNKFSLDIGDELHRTKYSRIHADTVELTLPELEVWEADTISADTLLKINVDEFNLTLHAGEIRVDGAIDINSKGDITNAGPLISRNHGINLKGQNISNNSEMLAAEFININASGNASNTGNISSFSSVAMSGGNESSNNGTIISKGGVVLEANRVSNSQIIKAEGTVSLLSTEYAYNSGTINANSVALRGATGGNSGAIYTNGLGGLSFSGVIADEEKRSGNHEAADGGAVSVGNINKGDAPLTLTAQGASVFTNPIAENKTNFNDVGEKTLESRTIPNTAAVPVNQGVSAQGTQSYQAQTVSGNLLDILRHQRSVLPEDDISNTSFTPEIPTPPSLEELFEGVEADRDRIAAGPSVPGLPNLSRNPADLSPEEREAATRVFVDISEEDFNQAAGLSDAAGSFWDTSEQMAELEAIRTRNMPTLEDPSGNLANDFFQSLAEELEREGFSGRGRFATLNDYTRSLSTFNSSFSPNAMDSDQSAISNGEGLGFNPLADGGLSYEQFASANQQLLDQGGFLNTGLIDTAAHTRIAINDDEALEDIAEETIDFLNNLPATAAGGSSPSAAGAEAALAQLGLEFNADENGNMNLSGQNLDGRALDNVQLSQNEDGQLVFSVADNKIDITLGTLVGDFKTNEQGEYVDGEDNVISEDAFKEQVSANNPDLFAQQGSAENQQNSLDYFTSVLNRATAGNTDTTALGGVTIAAEMQPGDASYNKMAGAFTNQGTINTGNLTVFADGANLVDGSELTSRGDVYLNVNNDIDLGRGQGISIGNDFIAHTESGDINLTATSETTTSKQGAKTTKTTSYQLAGLDIGGDMLWNAGNDINISGATVNVGGAAQLRAANDVLIEAVADVAHSIEERKRFREEKNEVTNISSAINTVGDMSIFAGNDLNVIGSHLAAGNEDVVSNISLAAKGNTTIASVQNESFWDYMKQKKGSFGRKTTWTKGHLNLTNVASTVTASGALNINRLAKEGGDLNNPELMDSGDVLIKGSTLAANDDITVISTLGTVGFEAAEELKSSFNDKSKRGALGLSSSSKGSTTRETLLAGAKSIGGGKTSIEGQGVRVIASSVTGEDTITLLGESEGVLISASAGNLTTEQWDLSKSLFSGDKIFELEAHKSGENTQVVYESLVKSNSGQTNIQGNTVDVIGSTVQGSGFVETLEDGSTQHRAGVNIIATDGPVNISSFQTMNTTFSSDKSVAAGFGDMSGGSPVKNEDGQIKIVLGSATYDSVKVNTSQTKQHAATVKSDDGVVISSNTGDVNIFGSQVIGDADQNGIGDVVVSALGGSINIAETKEKFYSETKETHGKGEVSFVIQHQAVELAKAALAIKEAEDGLKDAKDSLDDYQKQVKNLKAELVEMKAKKANDQPVSQQAINDAEYQLADLEGDESFYEAGVAAAAIGLTQAGIAMAQQAQAAASSTVAYGFNAGIQVDASVTKSTTTEQSTSSVASKLTGANIVLQAGKNEGQGITIQGSDVITSEEGSLLLSAKDVNILASRDTFSSRTESENASLSGQVTIFGAASGASLSGSYGQSMSKSSGITYTNSNVKAGNLILDVDNNMTVAGGTVRANNHLQADIGGELNITSMQNMSSSRSAGWGVSAGISLGGDGKADERKTGADGKSTGNIDSAKHGLNGDDINRVSGVHGGANVSSGNSFSRETIVSSLTSGGTAEVNVEGETTLIGSVLGTFDEEGNDLGTLGFTTAALKTENLANINYSNSSSAGFSVNVGFGQGEETKDANKTPEGSAGNEQANTATGEVQQTAQTEGGSQANTANAGTDAKPKNNNLNDTAPDGTRINSSSFNFANSTQSSRSSVLATVGEGNINIGGDTSEETLSGVNRDLTGSKVEHAGVDVGQSASFTVDHRLFSTKGREEIKKEIKEFPKNLQQAATNAVVSFEYAQAEVIESLEAIKGALGKDYADELTAPEVDNKGLALANDKNLQGILAKEDIKLVVTESGKVKTIDEQGNERYLGSEGIEKLAEFSQNLNDDIEELDAKAQELAGVQEKVVEGAQLIADENLEESYVAQAENPGKAPSGHDPSKTGLVATDSEINKAITDGDNTGVVIVEGVAMAAVAIPMGLAAAGGVVADMAIEAFKQDIVSKTASTLGVTEETVSVTVEGAQFVISVSSAAKAIKDSPELIDGIRSTADWVKDRGNRGGFGADKTPAPDGNPTTPNTNSTAGNNSNTPEWDTSQSRVDGEFSTPDRSVISIADQNVQIDSGKFDYMFGRVTSSPHNTARSLQLKEEFARVGIHDTPAGRNVISSHLDDVIKDPTNITGTFTKTVDGKVLSFETRQSLFSGPGGFLQFNSTFKVNADGTRSLSTVIPKGGN